VFLSIVEGFLIRGDIVVVDNASIHFGGDSLELLSTILLQLNIQPVFLPTYSPELN